MNDLAQSIADAAENAVAVCEQLRGEPLDYSESSLVAVEEIMAISVEYAVSGRPVPTREVPAWN
jgi:hypothetical protein